MLPQCYNKKHRKAHTKQFSTPAHTFTRNPNPGHSINYTRTPQMHIWLFLSGSDGTTFWLLVTKSKVPNLMENQCLPILTYFGFNSQILYRSAKHCYTKCLLNNYKCYLGEFCNDLS